MYTFMTKSGHLMMRGFMRKMYVHNSHKVPSDKPVLLAANHPTAFIDPCLLCTFIDPPLYNMTRGDIFRKPIFRRMMESINMFPVFRMRDGYTSRDRNDEVFQFCRTKLGQKRVVTIYVEGEHHLEKRVRPIQKGIVRIAFDTFSSLQIPDLQIIPAGCNYMYGDCPRDEAMVMIGDPIWVRDYWEEYQRDPNTAAARLTADIETGLKAVCFHVADPQDDILAEQMLTLHRSDHPYSYWPIVEYHNRRFLTEKSVCDQVNTLEQPRKQALKERALQYFSALDQSGLTDAALRQPGQGAWWRLLYFGLLLAPFLAGYLTSLPIILLSKYVANKTVKKREFYSSVRMGAGLISGMLYYFLWFLACLITWNPWWIGFSLVMPVLGWFSMFYREAWSRWLGARTALQHSDRVHLLSLRAAIDF